MKILSLALAAFMLAAAAASCNIFDYETAPIPEPIATPPATDDAAEAEPPALHRCTCDEPEGTLAPHSADKPDDINTKTPADTFVAGTAPMGGKFITDWNGNPHDHSVAVLTGGYKDTYRVTADGQIRLNGSVVCNVTAQYDKQWNKTYTFTLHSYLKWNNGESITAADYVGGILAYASPAFAALGGKSSIGEGIVGYEEYRFGSGSPDAENGAEAADGGPSPIFKGIRLLDDFTFSATIASKELPYFWETSLVTFRPVYIEGWFPGKTIISDENGARFANAPGSPGASTIGEDMERIAATELAAPTVTCGPYKFVSYDGKTATLERNEYFGVCPEGYVPYFEKIVQTEVGGGLGYEALRSGEIDFQADVNMDAALTPLEPEGAEDAGGSGSVPILDEFGYIIGYGEPEPPPVFVSLHRYPRAGFGFLEFALDFGPTQEYNVRRAITYTLNRAVIVDNALGGAGTVIEGVYSPAEWAYRARRGELTKGMTPFYLDIDKANELLDSTIWRFEADGATPFDAAKTKDDGTYLRHNANGDVLRIAVASGSPGIGRALEEAAAEGAPHAGMEFAVEQAGMKTLLEHYYNGKTFGEGERKWHAFQLATDFTPVHDMYWSYHSSLAGTYLNTNGVRDGELDRLTMEMRSLDPSQAEEYADLWLEFQLRWQEVLPAFPLYCNLYYDGYNNIVTQIPTSAYAGYHDVITHIAKHG